MPPPPGRPPPNAMPRRLLVTTWRGRALVRCWWGAKGRSRWRRNSPAGLPKRKPAPLCDPAGPALGRDPRGAQTSKTEQDAEEMVLLGVSETHVIKSVFVNLTENSDDVSRAKREFGLQTQHGVSGVFLYKAMLI